MFAKATNSTSCPGARQVAERPPHPVLRLEQHDARGVVDRGLVEDDRLLLAVPVDVVEDERRTVVAALGIFEAVVLGERASSSASLIARCSESAGRAHQIVGRRAEGGAGGEHQARRGRGEQFRDTRACRFLPSKEFARPAARLRRGRAYAQVSYANFIPLAARMSIARGGGAAPSQGRRRAGRCPRRRGRGVRGPAPSPCFPPR